MLLVTIATMVAAGTASATDFTVNTTADVTDVDAADGLCDADANLAGSQCSLRAAIQQANFSSSADVINLPAGTYKIDKRTCGSARCDEEQAAEDDLDVKYPVSIKGAGARSTIIDANSDTTGSGAPSTLQGIFEVTYGEPAVFAVSDVTLTGADANGAAINAYGASVELTRVTVKGNDGNSQASVYAALGDTGTHLTITDSTIGPNKGQGVRTVAMPSISIVNSTISGNSWQGFETAFDPSVLIIHSTISANGQAGLKFDDTKTPDNGGSAIVVHNSIIAGNHTVSDSIEHDCEGAPTMNGVNLAGDGSCGASLTAAPMLRALADNGGPTDTLLPEAGSPAVDVAEDCALLTADQRGQARPEGAACDLGAVEGHAAPTDGGSGGGGSGDGSGGGNNGGSGNDGSGNGAGAGSDTPPPHVPDAGEPTPQQPSGGSTPPKGVALGVYCKGESNKHVKGLKGTPFSRCVTAMTALSKKKATSPAQACKGLPKKKVKGMKKTPYAICVSGGKALLKARR